MAVENTENLENDRDNASHDVGVLSAFVRLGGKDPIVFTDLRNALELKLGAQPTQGASDPGKSG